jgi:hypothetical protein
LSGEVRKEVGNRSSASGRSPLRPSQRARPAPSEESDLSTTSSVAYPSDLAREVRRRLKEGKRDEGPGTTILLKLFEVLHFASLRTEEREPVVCSVTWMDPGKPDPHPPREKRPSRWSVTALANRLPLTIANVVKLSAAADPQACSLACYVDDANNVFIWGLIDQTQGAPNFSPERGEKQLERPGVFQATVSPAHLLVYRGPRLVASLIHGQLTHRFHDVFREGRIARTCDRYVLALVDRVRHRVGKDVFDAGDKWTEVIRRLWTSTLCRVLLAVQGYDKGGALLLVEEPVPSALSIKYELAYRRLGAAIERLAAVRIQGSHARDKIWTGYLLDEDSGDLPGDLYLEEGLASSEETACLQEIAGCVRFVASLSRADGLVLVDGDLAVKGFGCEITLPEEPRNVLLAGNAAGAAELCRPIDFNSFGIRHRSMMRYCDRFPGSVGFVVSQDGTIRALARDGERLIMWETLELS